jgi:hypothetical protein
MEIFSFYCFYVFYSKDKCIKDLDRELGKIGFEYEK